MHAAKDPLELAVSEGRINIALWLLAERLADSDGRVLPNTPWVWSLLIDACRYDQLPVIKALVEAGADLGVVV